VVKTKVLDPGVAVVLVVSGVANGLLPHPAASTKRLSKVFLIEPLKRHEVRTMLRNAKEARTEARASAPQVG